MTRLVNDMVDVARVQTGKLDLHLAPTDLDTIVREEGDGQRQIHPERALVLALREEQRVPVMADAQRIGQVVTNYLTNALKYLPADRPVTVGLQVDDQQVQAGYVIRDQGCPQRNRSTSGNAITGCSGPARHPLDHLPTPHRLRTPGPSGRTRLSRPETVGCQGARPLRPASPCGIVKPSPSSMPIARPVDVLI
jgi:hypothetical protein